MKTRTAPTAPESGADTRADRTVRNQGESTGARWTAEPIENSTAAAIYCPVVDTGRWNGVMHDLHRRDPGLAKRWGQSKRQPKGTDGRSGGRTTVLALARSGTPNPAGPLLLRGRQAGIRDPRRRTLRRSERPAAARDRRARGPRADERGGSRSDRCSLSRPPNRTRCPPRVGPRKRTDVRRTDGAGNYSANESERTRGSRNHGN